MIQARVLARVFSFARQRGTLLENWRCGDHPALHSAVPFRIHYAVCVQPTRNFESGSGGVLLDPHRTAAPEEPLGQGGTASFALDTSRRGRSRCSRATRTLNRCPSSGASLGPRFGTCPSCFASRFPRPWSVLGLGRISAVFTLHAQGAALSLCIRAHVQPLHVRGEGEGVARRSIRAFLGPVHLGRLR